MSESEREFETLSLPDEDNADGYDYPDKKDLVPLRGAEEMLLDEPSAKSISVHLPPLQLRYMNKIPNIIGEADESYVRFLARTMYNWKMLSIPYPKKYDAIIRYLDSRI